MESKKILQINVSVNDGSNGTIAELIGETAISNGWESYIAYGRRALKSKSNLIKIGNKIDLYLHVLLTRLFDCHGLASIRITRKLIKRIIEINPDIIHLHNIHGYFLNYKILFDYLSRADIPVVWTLHDCWAFTGHCAYFDYVGCEKWQNLCSECTQKKSYPASLILDRSKQNFLCKKKMFGSVKNMTIVPVSYWLGDVVQKSFLNKYPLKVIQNGIDISVFKPYTSSLNDLRGKFNIRNEKIVLGVASTWDLRKGLADFIKLNAILPSEFKIILIGLSKKQIKTLPKNILGIRRTENVQQLSQLYSLADVFVNPTWEDNFPTTNLESLACGTPVLTYNTGGSVESVSKDVGYVVGKGDIMALRNSILTIVEKGKENYSSICRERAEKNYDKDFCYKNYIDLFKTLIYK